MFCCLGYEWLSGGCKTWHSAWVINTLADHHHRGTDFGGSPWLRIIIAFPRSYKVVLTLWTVYLWLSFLKTIFQSENGHDVSTDVQQRARRSNRRRQEGNKIGLKDVITLRRHVETKGRAKIRKMKVTTKINHHDKINGKRKTAKKQKLSVKECEHAEKERQVSEAEENGKLDMKEIHTYMKMFQRAQELRRRAEDYHKCKIPPSARKALCNWVRMAAAEHRHSSGLPYWPYLTAETLKNRMGHQPPPPTQQHSITDNSLSLKTPPECLLTPLPPSADDNLKTPPECLLTPLPPSAPPSADDNLKTPPLATQEAEAEKPPKPKRWRAAEMESPPEPKRRRAAEVESPPEPKRRRAAEVEPSSPEPKRRRLSKLRTGHCTQA
uniref:Nuclear pore complex interacting protein family member B2 n=1 Tax=Homo sapiens TaxID=9606 RepID=F8VY45_HUMAN